MFKTGWQVFATSWKNLFFVEKNRPSSVFTDHTLLRNMGRLAANRKASYKQLPRLCSLHPLASAAS